MIGRPVLRALPVLLSVPLLLAGPFRAGRAADAPLPTFPQDVQGTWSVLLGVPAKTVGIADDDTGLIGGTVTLEAEKLVLRAPGGPGETVLTAECRRLAGPLLDEQQKPKPGTEAEATLSGKLAGKRRLTWVLSSQGLLHVKVLTADAVERSRYLSGAWGPGKDTLYLVLRRRPVPTRSKPDAVADAARLRGPWTAVAHYDDAFLKNPGLTGKRTLVFGPERIDEQDDKGQPARPPVGFWGPYRVAAPAGPFGGIDLQLESWAGGGAGLMGRTLGLYAFHGDDLLYLVYTETDRRPEEKRTRSEHFRSDGDQNLFILERAAK